MRVLLAWHPQHIELGPQGTMHPQLEVGLLELVPSIEGLVPWEFHPYGLLLHSLMVLLEVLLVAHHPHWCHLLHFPSLCLPK